MKPQIKRIATFAPAGILAAALASCGGGGGGGGDTLPALTYQSLVNSVSTVTYTSDSLLVSNQITSIRQNAGAGLVAQNTSLDAAAGSHAAFLIDNSLVSNGAYLTSVQSGGILGGHYENSTLAGYTGASPQVRATNAGYAGTVTELMIFGAATGNDCVNSLEDSVYHLIDLVSPFIDVGISFNAGTGSGSACAIELGVKSTTLGQLPAAGNQMFYPYAGQTGVQPTYYNQAEVPSPTTLTGSPAGHPVVISLYTLARPVLSGSDVKISTFSITPNGGSKLPAEILVYSGVTGGTADINMPSAGFAVLVPHSPLSPNTTYDVSFSATVKGQVVSKSWSFSTGNAN